MGRIILYRRNQSHRVFAKQIDHIKYMHCIAVTFFMLIIS